MKISIIIPDLRNGGVERMRLLLISEFQKKGYSIDLVLMRNQGELLPHTPENISIIELGANRLSNVLWPLTKYLRKEKPEAVLVAMWPLTVIACWAGFLSRVSKSVVVSEHNQQSSTPVFKKGFNKWLMPLSMKLSYPLVNKVVGVSKGVVDDLQKLSGLSSHHFTTVYNPAAPRSNDLEDIIPDNQFWKSDKSKRIISIGTLKQQKDYPTLIKAFEAVRNKVDSELLILGEGRERSLLEEMIRKRNIEDVVHMPGFVPNPLAYLKTADLFVLSSAWEGFGNVIVEALACGVPVVSTDCKSGPAEILENGKYGTLVPVGKPDALAKAILDNLNKQHDLEPLKSRAKDFEAEKIAQEYLELLFPN